MKKNKEKIAAASAIFNTIEYTIFFSSSCTRVMCSCCLFIIIFKPHTTYKAAPLTVCVLLESFCVCIIMLLYPKSAVFFLFFCIYFSILFRLSNVNRTQTRAFAINQLVYRVSILLSINCINTKSV